MIHSKPISNGMTFAKAVNQYNRGLLTNNELMALAPKGQRIEIMPAVIQLWDYGCKMYVETHRRERLTR